MLIPTLPDIAMVEVKAHVASGRLAVHRIIEQKPIATCQNCQDEGVIYVSLLGAGPSKQPIGMSKPSTYLGGDGYAKRGWYQIERTASYPCPRCSGARQRVPAARSRRPEVDQAVMRLAEDKAPRPVGDL